MYFNANSPRMAQNPEILQQHGFTLADYLEMERRVYKAEAERDAQKALVLILQKTIDTLLSHSLTEPKIKSATEAKPSLSITTVLEPLDPKDYPEAKYWKQAHYADYLERCINSNRSFSKANDLLTDEDGEQCTKERRGSFRAHANSIFSELEQSNAAPTTWKKHSITAGKYFHNQMAVKFPEFQLCEDDWKAEQYATNIYPDWCNTNRPKSSSSQKRTSPELPNRRKRMKMSPELAETVLSPEPAIAPSITATNSAEIVISSLPDSASEAQSVVSASPTLPPSPISAMSSPITLTAFSTPNSPVASTSKISLPTHSALFATSTLTTAIDTDPVPLSTNPTVSAHSSPSTSPTSPAPKDPMIAMINPLADFDIPETPNLPAAQPVDVPAKPPKVKKRKAVTPNTSASPRNLYLIDYLKECPDTTAEEFKAIWDNIDETILAKYTQDSKALKDFRKKNVVMIISKPEGTWWNYQQDGLPMSSDRSGVAQI
ncbi:hypothetical protein C8J56DRAFT_414153 [Mycena floridula]|nr:hypothetical protein C8J56DRAFT_414153 [Mycena floridula]